jgi:hypothetical protein
MGSASCASLSSDIYAAKVMGRSITKEELQEAQLAFSRPGTHEAMSIVTEQAFRAWISSGGSSQHGLDLIVDRAAEDCGGGRRLVAGWATVGPRHTSSGVVH